MAASNFPKCLTLVLKHEGGYVNHPKDPGGATNRGVIQRTYDSWRKSMGLKTRSVKQITDDEVGAIYRRDYWNKVSGDALPLGIDYATFDGGVNSGPSRGVKWLQKALGVPQDGAAGPKTLAAAKASDHRKTIVAMCAARMGFLRGLPHWGTFGKGWTRRVIGAAGVEAAAVAMVLTMTLPKASVPSELKAESSKAQTASTQQKAGAATSGTSGGATAATVDWTAWDSLTPWIVGGCVVGLVILAAVLIHKSRVNKARAEAYAAAAKEQAA